jgi:hypothetical protein
MRTYTRNFQTFQGQLFANQGITYKFLMNHPKKQGLFIYQVIPVEDPDAEYVRDWFVCGWSIKEALKVINKAKGGKLEGFSKTTCSGYSMLHDGRRVRISDHASMTARSKSDIEFTMSYRRAAIYLNDEIVYQVTRKSTAQELYNALANAF